MKYYLSLLLIFLLLYWEEILFLVFLSLFLFFQCHIFLLTNLGVILTLLYEEYLGDLMAMLVIFLSLVAFYYFMKYHLLQR